MKRIMIPIIAAICLTGMTACGSSNSDSSTADTTSAVNTEAETGKSGETSEAEKVTDEDKTSQQQEKTEPVSAETSESAGKDTVVVFFSATGTTEGVAERIAAAADADLYEIVPAEPYTDDDLDWNDDDSRTTIEMNDPDCRPEIDNDTADLESYSTVFIGYPIWWGEAPRIMSTFVESHSFDGKTVIPFCTSGSSPIGRSGSDLASQAGSGNWLEGSRLDADISESEILDWIDDMD